MIIEPGTNKKRELDDAHKTLDELNIVRVNNSKGKPRTLSVCQRIMILRDRERQSFHHRKKVYVDTVIEVINSLSKP